MVNAILGKKLGMTQIFRENGDAVPATVLKAGPCVVVQRKTAVKDGYEAAQIGLVEFPAPKRLTQALAGHFKRAGANPARFLREVRLGPGADDVKVGDKVLVDQFTVDERVDVIGVSKPLPLETPITSTRSSTVNCSTRTLSPTFTSSAPGPSLTSRRNRAGLAPAR